MSCPQALQPVYSVYTGCRACICPIYSGTGPYPVNTGYGPVPLYLPMYTPVFAYVGPYTDIPLYTLCTASLYIGCIAVFAYIHRYRACIPYIGLYTAIYRYIPYMGPYRAKYR